MAVTDASWWSVWWPWMLLWGSTIALMTATVMITASHRRTHRAITKPPAHGIVFYLDDNAVMNLYHSGYSAAVSREIEKTINRNQEGEVSAKLTPVQVGGRRGMNETEVSRFTEEAKPITVIGLIIDVLNKTDQIVYVDLRRREVTSNHALVKILDSEHDRRPKVIPLHKLAPGFVSVCGLFRKIEQTDSTLVLQALHDDPTATTQGLQVRVSYAMGELRSPVPTDLFEASCLGRVKWDPQNRCPVLDPIAIFLR